MPGGPLGDWPEKDMPENSPAAMTADDAYIIAETYVYIHQPQVFLNMKIFTQDFLIPERRFFDSRDFYCTTI